MRSWSGAARLPLAVVKLDDWLEELFACRNPGLVNVTNLVRLSQEARQRDIFVDTLPNRWNVPSMRPVLMAWCFQRGPSFWPSAGAKPQNEHNSGKSGLARSGGALFCGGVAKGDVT